MYPVSTADKAFFERVRKAVLEDDVEWLSQALVSYPFTVGLEAGQIKLKSEKDLKKHAKTIFNAKLKEAVRNQSPDTLFKNWQGVMIGNGVIWFSETEQKDKGATVLVCRIIAIYVPADQPNKTPKKTRTDSTGQFSGNGGT